jgi:Papain family cysteine protease
MAAPMTAGELRALMKKAGSSWTIDERLDDVDPVPSHSTGCDLHKVPKATEVSRIDIKPFLSSDTSNPFLRKLRLGRGFLKTEAIAKELLDRAAEPAAIHHTGGPTPAVTPAPAISSAVDWRNRFGWPWLTRIKNQDPCESCWVFAAVGALEATTRIEHTIWSLRSEGDVHDGMGAQCATTGDPGNALNWIQSNGVADPGCWPYETSNLPYHPTADRDGRTVKLDSYVVLNNVADQKAWIDNVGPLAACFTCYWDFQGYGPNSGVYICNPASGIDGGHCITVVGYDDSKGAWLIRNSWGTGWGMAGYCWFGYGQCGIDTNVKYGVPTGATNPDPWTKRRAHNGNFYESGDGSYHRNFEVWAHIPDHEIRHYWRDGVTLNWSVAETQAHDCASTPTVTGTTYNRNFEMVYQTRNHRLHHRYFNQTSQQWEDGPIFGPHDVAGIPGFTQGDYEAPGNFELVVRVANGELVHWWRNELTGAWAQSASFGSHVAHSAATLIQRFDNGLDVVVVKDDGKMQRYWRDDVHHKPWAAVETFGSHVKSPPVMIQGEFGATDETVPGNYELCVAVDGAIQHWWTPTTGTFSWAHSATFGTHVKQVLGLIQSSFGFDLEVIALLENGSLQHFYRNATWHAGPIIATGT